MQYIPEGQVGRGSIPEGQVGSVSIPEGQVVSGSIPEGQVLRGSIPEGQVVRGSIPEGQVVRGSIYLRARLLAKSAASWRPVASVLATDSLRLSRLGIVPNVPS